ncbi:MAG: hypothetical protein K6F27_09765 [Ruminococcus sp.]|nr:hypothetical protein [Ruminococcus sp.]
MKSRITAFLLSILFVFSTACGDSDSSNSKPKITETTTSKFDFRDIDFDDSSRSSVSSASDTTTTAQESKETSSTSKTTTTTTKASTTASSSDTTSSQTQATKTAKASSAVTASTTRTTQATKPATAATKVTTKATMNIVSIDQTKLLEAYKALIAGTSTSSQRDLIRLDLVQYTFQKYGPALNTGLYVFTDASGKPTADENKRVKDGNCGFNFGCSHEYETTDYYHKKLTLDEAAKKYMNMMREHIDSDAQYINQKSNVPFSQQGFNVVLYKSKYDAMLYYDSAHTNVPLYVAVLCYTGG